MGESIGRGGLGDVFRGQDTQLNRPVAIKRLHTEQAPGKFMQEARHLAALQHPNIVTVYDYIESDGEVVVVMELLRGRTLQDIAEKAPLLESDFLQTMRQTLEGLIAAHSIGMLHRDIKPSNIMLIDLPSGAFQVKVLDFGLAKITMEPSLQSTENNSLLGSVYTMSPEQFESQPLDARSDLYSLGCVAYFILTGYYPFAGRTVPEVICAHLQQRATPLAEMRPDVSPALCDWVARLMSLSPNDRPASAAQALAELNAALGPAPHTAAIPVSYTPPPPVPSTPVSSAPPPTPPASSSTPLYIGMAAAVAVIIGAVAYFVWPTAKPKPVDSATAAPAASATPETAAATPAPASTPEALPQVFAPLDKAALIAQSGKHVIVEGDIQRQGVNKTGSVRFLNFAGSQRGDLCLVFFTKSGTDFSEQRLGEYIGKKIRVTGTVSLYNGEPQLVINSFSQIQTL